MKKAILVHGKPTKENYDDAAQPSPSNAIWFPWLQKQLLLRDISAQAPEMLRSYQPDYRLWNETFEASALDGETTLIGHSCGSGFLAQWLSEHPDTKVGDVFLVAPSFGDRFNPELPYDYPLLGGFFDFTIDETLLERVKSLHVLYSYDDSPRVDTAVSMLKTALPSANYHAFEGRGHFTATADNEFTDLLELIDAARSDDM